MSLMMSFVLILPQIKELGSEVLGKHTLREILTKILGSERTEQLCLEFPYRAEIDTLRADLAIQSFQGEMGTYDDYFVIKEGYQALPKAMADEFNSLGGTILFGQEVIEVQSCGNVLVKTLTDAGEVLWEAPDRYFYASCGCHETNTHYSKGIPTLKISSNGTSWCVYMLYFL
jgi:hypothetical protein